MRRGSPCKFCVGVFSGLADRRSVGGGKVSRGGPLRVHGIWPGSVQWVGVEFQCARRRKPSGKSGIPWTVSTGWHRLSVCHTMVS